MFLCRYQSKKFRPAILRVSTTFHVPGFASTGSATQLFLRSTNIRSQHYNLWSQSQLLTSFVTAAVISEILLLILKLQCNLCVKTGKWHFLIVFIHRHCSYSEPFCGSAGKGWCFPRATAAAAKQGLKENLGTDEHFHVIIPLKLEDVRAAFIQTGIFQIPQTCCICNTA